MAKANTFRKKSRTVADVIRPMMVGIYRKRGFANGDILHNWSAIVGSQYAGRVMPEKIIWPRIKDKEGQSQPEPGTLVVTTDSVTAVLLVHDKTQLIERINTYFGWQAVNKIKIKDGPVVFKEDRKPEKLRALTPAEVAKLQSEVKDIKKESLREAIYNLGERIMASRPPVDESQESDEDNQDLGDSPENSSPTEATADAESNSDHEPQ